MSITYGLKEVFSQSKFSSNSISPGKLPLVISPRKVYYFEKGDGGESADTRLVKCIKDPSTGEWSCSSVLSETGGWWLSVLHVLLKDKEYMLGAWAVVPNPKLWIVNDTVITKTYGASNHQNLGHTIYLSEHDKFLTGGECSGNKLRLIDPNNDWAEVASWSFSWLSGKSYGKIDIVPRNDDKLYILAGIGTASASPRNAILGIVDIDDLLANPNSYIDQLGSWEQLKDFGAYPRCTVLRCYNARWIEIETTTDIMVYDPVNDVVILNDRPRLLFGDGGFATYDEDNGILTLYDKSGNQLAQITGLSYASMDTELDTQLFAMASDSTMTINYLLALTMNGYTPIPEVDLVNNKFRIIDFHTEQEIAFRVMIVWSKIGNGLVSPIIVDETRTQTLDVNGWISIPRPPSAGKWLMTIVPLQPL